MRPILQTMWATDFDALRMKLISIGQFVTFVVTACSVIANAIPKYESMARPKLRWVCRQLARIVAFGALNWRRQVHVLGWRICREGEVRRDDDHE
ncbi:hypothetical protein [Edaphobacter albus]|uniref:hypothetical protein n=1 Tax=Edaphobacter sp. 4G125 TaxID=2763071 RepID=UPI001646080B|nr:hypothetical protein [Edaphobacter sp. 4G125]QNI37534.1 hypothetical protein H7846_04315 [Edaphobacter sp. 4G125]